MEAGQRQAEAVRVAAALGGDFNDINASGQTALHGAALNGADNVVQFLADHGGRLDAKDNSGRAPIDLARAAQLSASVVEHKTTVNLLKRLLDESAR